MEWHVAGPFKVGEVLMMIHADSPVYGLHSTLESNIDIRFEGGAHILVGVPRMRCESCGMPYPKTTGGRGTLTQQDADRLRTHAEWYEGSIKGVTRAIAQEDWAEWQLRNLADRIEAALPPDEDPK